MEMVFERGSNTQQNKRGNNCRNNTARKILVRSLVVIQLVLAAILNAKLLEMDLLPKKYDIILVLVIVLINILTWYSIRKLNTAVLMSLTSLLVTSFMVACILSVFKIDSAIGSVITDKSYQIVQIGVIVQSESDLSDVKEISGKTIGYIEEDMETMKKGLGEDFELSSKCKESTDTVSLVKSLLDGDVEVALLNISHLDMVKDIEGYEDLDQKIRILHTYEIKIEKESAKTKAVDKDTFVVYVSGSDSREGMLVTSRSDVNILAVVNKKEGKVQLINTPRDYYVEIAGCNGQKDKLTHAGVKGISTSIKTLEKLYDVEIDYYFKINFSGFTSIIDEVGGVDVYSKQSFTAITGHSYKQGVNHLNGKEALAFARERYALKGGDDQRGENQMAVIKAMTDKLMSAEILKNYDDILKCVSGCVDMDIPTEEIYGIVKNQLADNKKWEINSASVSGTGLKTTTYMSSTPIWVTQPNNDDVEKAKELIKECTNNN